MSAQFSVIRYVPDPITEECVNFGVVAWDGERIRCRFLSNWTRVRSFGQQKLDFLREFAKEMTAVTAHLVCTYSTDEVRWFVRHRSESVGERSAAAVVHGV